MDKHLKIEKLYKAINKAQEAVVILLFMAMVSIIVIEVFSRYLFKFSFSWGQDFSLLCFIWITFLGASLGAKKGQLIKIDSFLFFMPKKILPYIKLIISIIIIGFLIFLIRWSFDTVIVTWDTIMPSGLNWPRSTYSMSLMVASPLLLLDYLVIVVKDFKDIIS